MRHFLLPVLFAVLVSIAGCAKPEYMVPGLTLPSGSTVVNKSETTTESGGGSSLPVQIPGVNNKQGKSLVVSFNCAEGFEAVSAHINTCLASKGFSDSSSGLGSMAGVPGLEKMLGSMKMWDNKQTGYAVMLEDMSGILGKGFAKLQGGAGAAAGQYMLMVYRTK